MTNSNQNIKKKKKTKRGGTKRKVSPDQVRALNSIHEWVFTDHETCSAASGVDVLQKKKNLVSDKVCSKCIHILICSDGFLSPSKLVERAHGNGVKVLALTDHDTMAGIPEALKIASKYGINIIPGVEISTMFSSSGEPGTEEPVHILAY